MAIGNAAKIAKQNSGKRDKVAAGKSDSASTRKTAPLQSHEDRSVTLRLYIKDKALLKRAKIAALEDETSLSQLWEEWTTDWLDNR